MKPLELQRAIRGKEIAPLYFFYGNETFLLERTLECLRGELVDPALAAFNHTVFYGKETTSGDIIAAARTHPLMGKRRLVVVKEADSLKSPWTDFVPYFIRPLPSTCLVFSAEKLPLKSDSLAAFKRHGIPVKFSHPYDRELPGWVRSMAQEYHKKISAPAAALLSAAVESDLQTVHNEVVKVATYVGERKVIEPDDVREVLTPGRGGSIFTLTDRIADRNREGALCTLNQLLEAGEPPLKIHTMITRQVRRLAQAKELLQQGTSREEVGKRLGVHGFFLGGFLKRAGSFPLEQAADCYSLLFLSEWRLKSSRVDKKIILENLVAGLCRR